MRLTNIIAAAIAGLAATCAWAQNDVLWTSLAGSPSLISGSYTGRDGLIHRMDIGKVKKGNIQVTLATSNPNATVKQTRVDSAIPLAIVFYGAGEQFLTIAAKQSKCLNTTYYGCVTATVKNAVGKQLIRKMANSKAVQVSVGSIQQGSPGKGLLIPVPTAGFHEAVRKSGILD